MERDHGSDQYRILSNHELLRLGNNLDRWMASNSNSPIQDDEDSLSFSNALNLSRDPLLSEAQINPPTTRNITNINPSIKFSMNPIYPPIKILPKKPKITDIREVPMLTTSPINSKIFDHLNNKSMKLINRDKINFNLNKDIIDSKEQNFITVQTKNNGLSENPVKLSPISLILKPQNDFDIVRETSVHSNELHLNNNSNSKVKNIKKIKKKRFIIVETDGPFQMNPFKNPLLVFNNKPQKDAEIIKDKTMSTGKDAILGTLPLTLLQNKNTDKTESPLATPDINKQNDLHKDLKGSQDSGPTQESYKISFLHKTKKPTPVDKPLDLKTDVNANALPVTFKERQKDQILRDRKVITVEMIFTRQGVGVFLRDVNGEQIFLTQNIKLSGVSCAPSRYQTVKNTIFLPICDKTKLTIPQIITSIAAKIHLCPIKDCTEAFLQPALAKAHALKHLGLKPYKCPHTNCKWEFFKETHLTRHLSTHEGKKQFVCDVAGCDKDFTTIYNLNNHKKFIHAKLPNILCPVEGCEETFLYDRALKRHCARMHSESEAPFQCNFENCTRSFFSELALEIHSKTHSITNKHVCNFPDCGRVCNSAYRLKEHIRSHTGSRPYGCDYPGCKWRFTTASKLKRHFKTHRDDKFYSCNVPGCNKTYRRNEHLRSHLQTHVQMAEMSETTKCQFCGVLHVSKSAHMKKFHPDIKDIVEAEKLLGITPGSNSPLTLTFSSDDTFVVDSTSTLPNNTSVVQTKVDKQIGTDEKNDDELLEEAIKSLGVPEMVLKEATDLDLLPAVEDFSTVNLKDLD